MNQYQPLVSIFSFCKNRASTIRRCIESVLGQSYRNIEFVIQDGASTDGTVDIIKSYNDPRIKLVSAPDSGPAEAFWMALNRCEGEIIGSCLADEELLSQAVEEAVKIFSENPRLGAVTRDGYITDARGQVTGEFIAGDFDFVDYLFGRYCPLWVASFFRRRALLDVGLKDSEWTIGCLEFEIWCRLGTQHIVKYVPGIVAKYGVSDAQLSSTPQNMIEHIESRAAVIEQLFSEKGFFGYDRIKKVACLCNQYYLFYNHARSYRLLDSMERFYHIIKRIIESLGPYEALQYERLLSMSSLSSGRADFTGMALRIWMWWSFKIPRFLKRLLTAKQRAAIRYFALNAMCGVLSLKFLPRRWFAEKGAAAGLTPLVYSKRLYDEVASRYYARGQIDYAQFLWRKAEELNDVTIDSIAVQASLFSPTATNDSLLDGQKRWASRHAKPLAGLSPLKVVPYRGDRKIRVAYHCSFFDSDTMRANFAPVARKHDRRRFEVVAYSIAAAAGDIERAFDEFKVIRVMPDREFVKIVRKDRIDILVEMSGFSPLNRFLAMASRCGPIQVSYLNHSGTSGTPNVDYVLGDAISVPREDDKYFTEKVWRLEDAFLCYNYDWENLPDPVTAPYPKNGYCTFGCFGSGGKIGDDLIELWAQILHRVPKSRLFLRNNQLSPVANRQFMVDRFRRHSIGEDRLRLLGGAERSIIMKDYEDVDISLDTWPYCGGNTIGESIWQGVPVITLRGNRFSSRYGASLVTAAGCGDLVAEAPERYVEIAAELAAAPERILFYRRNLRRMSKEHGLTDPERFARKLEKAYLEMMNTLQTELSNPIVSATALDVA